MTDFADEVRKRVRDSVDREARRQEQQQAEQRECERRAEEQARRIRALLPRVDQRFREAEAASESALRYIAPRAGGGRAPGPRPPTGEHTFRLEWRGPGRQRLLVLTIAERGGLSVNMTGPDGAASVRSGGLDEETLEEVDRAILDFIGGGADTPVP